MNAPMYRKDSVKTRQPAIPIPLALPLAISLMALVSLLALSCGKNDNKSAVSTAYTSRQIAEVVMCSLSGLPEMLPLSMDDAFFGDFLSTVYGLDPSALADGFVFYANGVFASEIAVFLMSQQSHANEAKEALTEYIRAREGVFAGYAPVEASILKYSVVAVRGPYVALLICGEAQRAEDAFLACFSDTPPPLPDDGFLASAASPPGVNGDPSPTQTRPPGREPGQSHASVADSGSGASRDPDASHGTEMPQAPVPLTKPDPGPKQKPGPDPASKPGSPADHKPKPAPTPLRETGAPPGDVSPKPAGLIPDYGRDAILAAAKSGNLSPLTDKEKAILTACQAVIAAVVSDSMGEYEKELAIHDWIIAWASYDEEALNNKPSAKPDPDNDNPYGLLINGKAICSGYTSTFQLFMDLLGIECIIVEGGTSYGEEHAWNMVRIDGEWYCVDVTWNDPIGVVQTDSMRHTYFNVSSDFMRGSKHVWDESLVPEAAAPGQYHR